MPGACDALHQVGVALRDPSQDEERAARVVAGEQLEQPVDVLLHAAAGALPLGARDVRRQGLDLEVLFHVDGEVMRDRHAVEVAAPASRGPRPAAAVLARL